MESKISQKMIHAIQRSADRHWVGDGFPVRSLFSYNTHGDRVSPFLLLDYAGPHYFEPAAHPRGVGEHPHRGFETVTIVYEGAVSHRDSTGEGGTIGPGDVQWMTAASGIQHEEFHSPGFTRTGGPFKMVQLWVNLPAQDKSSPPKYQGIVAADVPSVDLGAGDGSLRVIAGEFFGKRGPANTFTPMNVWDMRLHGDRSFSFSLPEAHTAMLVVLSGSIGFPGDESAGEAEVVLLERSGTDLSFNTLVDSSVLLLTGEPIDEPIFGYGPFVMNTAAEVRKAMEDFDRGRFGAIPAETPERNTSHE